MHVNVTADLIVNYGEMCRLVCDTCIDRDIHFSLCVPLFYIPWFSNEQLYLYYDSPTKIQQYNCQQT